MLNLKPKLLVVKPLMLWLLLGSYLPVYADVLVLVHGWRSNADSWLINGVHTVLVNNGWQDVGMTVLYPESVRLLQQHPPTEKNKLYRVNLPAHLGLQTQADYLRHQLNYLHQLHRDERIIIAAHSAGGLVSRIVLVQQHRPRVDALITIASPHLGTPRAIEGLDIVHSKPFFCPGPGMAVIKSIIGRDDYHYLRHSDALLVDLLPSRQGNIIHWLNQQPHPDIHYHSIIKQQHGSSSDGMVPTFSQDMNNVPRLKGKSTTHWSYSNHDLNPQDGQIIINILHPGS